MRVVQMRAQLAEIDSELAELNVVAPNDCVLEVLNVKVGDVLAPHQEIATLILRNICGFACTSGNVARMDRARGCCPVTSRFVPERRFCRNGGANQSPG